MWVIVFHNYEINYRLTFTDSESASKVICFICDMNQFVITKFDPWKLIVIVIYVKIQSSDDEGALEFAQGQVGLVEVKDANTPVVEEVVAVTVDGEDIEIEDI